MSDILYNTLIPADRLAGIRLIALDLDGTLFNDQGEITPPTLDIIRRLNERGIRVVISTGRPFSGVPFEQIRTTGIDYALTTNGAAVYRIHDRKCIHEQPMDDEVILPVLHWLLSKDVHIAAFIDGDGISPEHCRNMVPDLILPDSVKYTLEKTRVHVPDLEGWIAEHHCHIQKVTVNFRKGPDGTLICRDETADYLMRQSGLEVVCGGFMDQEITGLGIDKGKGLKHLADHLCIPMEATMAVGDTENDLAILRAAGIAAAMGNATDTVKAESDLITSSNNEDGVAKVLKLL